MSGLFPLVSPGSISKQRTHRSASTYYLDVMSSPSCHVKVLPSSSSSSSPSSFHSTTSHSSQGKGRSHSHQSYLYIGVRRYRFLVPWCLYYYPSFFLSVYFCRRFYSAWIYPGIIKGSVECWVWWDVVGIASKSLCESGRYVLHASTMGFWKVWRLKVNWKKTLELTEGERDSCTSGIFQGQREQNIDETRIKVHDGKVSRMSEMRTTWAQPFPRGN